MTYPQANYSLWLDSFTGTRLASLDNLVSLSMGRKQGAVGRCVITLPYDAVDPSLLQPDRLVEIWRKIPNQSPRLRELTIVRKIEYSRAEETDLVRLTCENGNSLLAGRIVAYRTQNANAAMTDNADDMLKAIVRANLGSTATNTDRDRTAYNVLVEADGALAPSLTWKFAWKNVLDVLNEIVQLSFQEDATRLYFDMVPTLVGTSAAGWTFRTRINRWGADRSYASNLPTVFGPQWGNLTDPVLTYDYTEEVNAIYVVGQGETADKRVVLEEDSARVVYSPWSRREGFLRAREEATDAGLTRKAKRMLRKKGPKRLFSGVLVDCPQSRFGGDWDEGDLVQVVYHDEQFTAEIGGISLIVDETGLETIMCEILEVEI